MDDAQWLDSASADVIAYAARRVGGHTSEPWSRSGGPSTDPSRNQPKSIPGPPTVPRQAAAGLPRTDRDPSRVRSRVRGRSPSGTESGAEANETRTPRRAGPAAALAPPPVHEIAVPPLAADDLAELLELYGLPARAASKLHADSGGNPYLALALGGAFADRTAVAWRPVPLPQRIHALLRDRRRRPAGRGAGDAADGRARDPADGRAAAAGRAGRGRARHPARRRRRPARHRRQRGPVHPAGGGHGRRRVGDGAARRSAVHTALSTVVTDAVERARHRALASANPDAEVARSLVTAAENARRRGARGLAAELYLLAADRTPAGAGTPSGWSGWSPRPRPARRPAGRRS